ncbi:MAG TPA: sigma-70 family RNA polymerase sigma factor [Planctomycetaceae bacterium]|jgi:RNA polymerase sigma-70 factor (ECF subfamily)
MLEDEQAIHRVLSGDREAFRSLVTRHQSAVCATIRALSPRGVDWEDVAQDVFLAAFQHLATFDSRKGIFRTWLLAIARNQCRNAGRRLVPVSAAMIRERVDSRTPDVTVAEAEWFERLDASLAALPEEQRLMFVLVELQGVSYQEAADIADVSVGTVKSRLFRAKAWLREILGPMAPESNRSVAAPTHQNL